MVLTFGLSDFQSLKTDDSDVQNLRFSERFDNCQSDVFSDNFSNQIPLYKEAVVEQQGGLWKE